MAQMLQPSGSSPSNFGWRDALGSLSRAGLGDNYAPKGGGPAHCRTAQIRPKRPSGAGRSAIRRLYGQVDRKILRHFTVIVGLNFDRSRILHRTSFWSFTESSDFDFAFGMMGTRC